MNTNETDRAPRPTDTQKARPSTQEDGPSSVDEFFAVEDDFADNFISIQNRAHDEYLRHIGPSAWAVYSCLKRHRNQKTGQLNPRHSTIATECGLSRRTVIRAIQTLIEEGLVVQKQTNGGANLYRLPHVEPRREGVTRSHRGRDTVSQGGVTNLHIEQDNSEQDKKKKTPAKPATRTRVKTDYDLLAEAVIEALKIDIQAYGGYGRLRKELYPIYESGMRPEHVLPFCSWYLRLFDGKIPVRSVPSIQRYWGQFQADYAKVTARASATPQPEEPVYNPNARFI